jgi:hypothetical protein
MILNAVLDTLKSFDYDLCKILKEKYLDILLYGSSTINGFTPNQGDIDFIVVLKDNLVKSEINLIFELHENYRSGKSINLEHQLEGTYYPKKILEDIKIDICGCYVGTGRQGWKMITSFQHNCFDLIQLKNNAISYKNIQYSIYEPCKEKINEFVLSEIENFENYMDNNIIPSHVIIQFVARTLYYFEHRKIGTKKEACIEYSKRLGESDFIKKCGDANYTKNWEIFESQFIDHKNMAKNSLKDLRNIVEKDPNYT